jgi:hypothetical protein
MGCHFVSWCHDDKKMLNYTELMYKMLHNMLFYSNSRGPVPVLVMSLLFIASVFMLHIWGKYTRS